MQYFPAQFITKHDDKLNMKLQAVSLGIVKTEALTTVCRLIGPIAAVVHCIAFPPEWDALICSAAKLHKHPPC